MAHGQVFAHQELDELAVFFAEAMVTRKFAHFATAELRVVAASAFGYVMEQSGGKQNPRLVPTRGEL
jgi:hypothetical protein